MWYEYFSPFPLICCDSYVRDAEYSLQTYVTWGYSSKPGSVEAAVSSYAAAVRQNYQKIWRSKILFPVPKRTQKQCSFLYRPSQKRS